MIINMLNLFDPLLIKISSKSKIGNGVQQHSHFRLVSALERTLYLSGYALVAELMIFDQ
jgi:hypothetical protein